MIFALYASYLNYFYWMFFIQSIVTGALVENISLVLKNGICKIRLDVPVIYFS